MNSSQAWVLGILMVGVVYTFFIHDRVDYSLLPWNRGPGDGGDWDEQIARQAAATLEMEVTTAELFPSPPVARNISDHDELMQPPSNITELEEWVKKAMADLELKKYKESLADKWGTETRQFIELRTDQERKWLLLESELNRLYGWFNAFYNGMLDSKMHVNTMHEAPPAPPPPPARPETSKAEAASAIKVEEVDALITEEAEAHVNLTQYGGNDTAALLAAAGQLNARIKREQSSIDFIRSSIKSYEKAHKAQGNSIADIRAKKLGACEDEAEVRRQTFLELHTFMDSIFENMSTGLEKARVELIRIRGNPTDGRSAEEEISSMLDKLHRRDPAMSHELAQVMPQARMRGAQLARLNITLIEFKKQAKDIDTLMQNLGNIAEVLIPTFKGVFDSDGSLSDAEAMLENNKRALNVFKEGFEVTMKQKDLAYKIVQLASGLADISMQKMDKKTIDGLAVQLHNLDGVDEDVKSEAESFKVVVQTEQTLAGIVSNVVAFVGECSKLVKSADLSLTAGKAKIMNYYASHKLYSADPEGRTKQLNNLDTRAPHAPLPPAAPPIKYDYAKAINRQKSQSNWWKKAPAPPPLPKGYG